jgi:hypothetical protein
MSKPTINIGVIQYRKNGLGQDEYELKMQLTNCDPTQCRMFIASEHDGKEYIQEEYDDLQLEEMGLTLFGATTFHLYLFCGNLDQFKNYHGNDIIEKMRTFCQDPGNGCTMTKETIRVASPPRGGRHRKSHPRSSGSKRRGSKRSGSKRSGSKRSGSKRSGSKRRRCRR